MIAKITFEGENKCAALWLDGDITMRIRAVFQALRAYFLFLKDEKEKGNSQAIKSLCGYSRINAPYIECTGETAKIKEALLNDWKDKMAVLDDIFPENIGIYCDKIIKYDFNGESIEINPNVTLVSNDEEIYAPFDEEEKCRNFFDFLENAINIFKERYNVTKRKILENAHVAKQYLWEYEKKEYLPGKDTVIKLAFVLKYSLKEAETLLKLAGVCFIPGDNRDRTIKKCFKDEFFKFFDPENIIDKVNEELKKAGEAPL